MTVKVKWGKTPFRTYECWYCLYGNIITESQKSPEACFQSHLRKLKKYGVDISKFDDKPIIESEVQYGR